MSEIKELLGLLDDNIPDIPIRKDPDGILKEPKFVDEAKSTLNEDQMKAFEGLIDFMLSNKKMITISGFAGTGKSYLISKFFSSLDNATIAATAPTNKATKVLREMGVMGSDVTYKTIHKLLALKMQWMFPKKEEKWKPYQKLVHIRGKMPMVQNYNILIVDEVSMLSDKLFFMIKDEVKFCNTKVIFLGDIAQIPPIKDKKDSLSIDDLDAIPLVERYRKEHNIGFYLLSTPMRQSSDSGILRTANSIRNLRFKEIDTIEDRTNTNDTKFDIVDSDDFMKDIYEKFISNEFKNNSDYAKVISWRNVTVHKFNSIIRTFIYETNDLPFIMKNEKLIANSSIANEEGPVFNTSDEFEVVDYEEDTYYYRIESDDKMLSIIDNNEDINIKSGIALHYLDTQVRVPIALDGEPSYDYYEIHILLPESYESLKHAKRKAYQNKRWSDYAMLSERFAQVSYNYAITAHKSQGSSYENVYIIEDDIDKNWEDLTRNRIKYTAVSRASKQLRILSRRNV